MKAEHSLALIVLALVILACTPSPTPGHSTKLPEPTRAVEATAEQPVTIAAQPTAQPTEFSETQPPPSWNPDGIIGENEYAHEASIGDVRLWWRNDAQHLYVAFEAKTSGWVAIGLDQLPHRHLFQWASDGYRRLRYGRDRRHPSCR